MFEQLNKNYLLKKMFKDNEFENLSCDDKAFFVSRKFYSEISFFLKRLFETHPDYKFPYLDSNLKTLKIETHFKFCQLFLYNALAIYVSSQNKISIYRDDVSKYIYHELFHMLTSYYSEKLDMYFCGFKQYKLFEYRFGFGLNEGYTQLLTERYFADKDVAKTYFLETFLAKEFEKLMGKRFMEDCYFRADLYSIKKECLKYVSSKEFDKFICDFDFILNHSLVFYQNYDEDFQNTLDDIFGFFINIFESKQYKKVKMLEISLDEFYKSVIDFRNRLDNLYYKREDLKQKILKI